MKASCFGKPGSLRIGGGGKVGKTAKPAVGQAGYLADENKPNPIGGSAAERAAAAEDQLDEPAGGGQ